MASLSYSQRSSPTRNRILPPNLFPLILRFSWVAPAVGKPYILLYWDVSVLEISFENTFPRFRSRVPGVYLIWVNSVFLSFFSFNGINNLCVFNVVFGSNPTVPTISLSDIWTLNNMARGKKGQIRAMIRFSVSFSAAWVTTGF